MLTVWIDSDFKPNKKGNGKMIPLDIVIPVYNENSDLVLDTLQQLKAVFNTRTDVTIIVVDDGSSEKYSLDSIRGEPGIIFLKHSVNQGYGASLKTGITSGKAPMIAILDADGTYPVDALPSLVEHMENADMVVGARSSSVRYIPLMRRFPKYLLGKLATYMAGRQVVDQLNRK